MLDRVSIMISKGHSAFSRKTTTNIHIKRPPQSGRNWKRIASQMGQRKKKNEYTIMLTPGSHFVNWEGKKRSDQTRASPPPAGALKLLRFDFWLASPPCFVMILGWPWHPDEGYGVRSNSAHRTRAFPPYDRGQPGNVGLSTVPMPDIYF